MGSFIKNPSQQIGYLSFLVKYRENNKTIRRCDWNRFNGDKETSLKYIGYLKGNCLIC